MKICYSPLVIGLCLVLSLSPRFAFAKDGPGEFSFRATLPMEAAQREKLKAIVSNDTEAAALFSLLEKEATTKLDLEPNPIAKINYEGLVNTNPQRIKSVESLREMDDVATVFQYWQVSENPRAAAMLQRFILAWAETYVPTGNDVNENKFYPIFTAYESLRETFPEENRNKIDAWILTMGELHAEAVASSTHLTNRYTKHLRLLALFGRILDKPEWQEAAQVGLKRFVTESLRPDGTSLDLERRDTLTYHNSALRPVIELAVLAGPDGPALYNWTSPQNSSLKKSVDYVIPYADGTLKREEWRNTQVDLDRRRAAAGLAEYQPGKLFDPKDALKLMEEASFFDEDLVPLAIKLHESKANKFASWTMVMNAACR